MDTGLRLRRLREAAGLTQEEVGSRMDPPMTGQAVAKWEHGTVPRLAALRQLAKLYGCTIGDMLDEALDGRSAFLPLVASAHMGAFDSDEADRMVEVPASVAANHPHGKVLHGIGSCMNRRLPEDAVLVVDPDMEPRSGSIVVAERGGQLMVRLFSRGSSTLMLAADSWSSEFEDIIVRPEDDPVAILGVVVWWQAYEDVRWGR